MFRLNFIGNFIFGVNLGKFLLVIPTFYAIFHARLR